MLFLPAKRAKNLPNEPKNLPNGPCNLPKHVKNALFDYKYATFAAASRGFRDSKQTTLRQQAGDIAAASGRHCDSKQEANTATLSYFAFCILHFAFELRSNLLSLGIAQM